MEITTATPRYEICDICAAPDVSGREHLVVMTKASWKIPLPGQQLLRADPPPLCASDVFYGEPGESAIRVAGDFVRFKARCDVLFDACAHTPGGKPLPWLDVSAQVGDWRKDIHVVGPRQWQQGLVSLTPSQPKDFISMPLHYGHAYGGTRNGKNFSEALLSNTVGLGWGGPRSWYTLKGAPVPNLEYPQDPVHAPDGGHRPAAFSAVAPGWKPRSQYTGTYDGAWKRDRAPLLPKDFDERFYQSAPEDQQIAYPKGGEQVRLRHMIAGVPDVSFTLPPLTDMKVRILRQDLSAETLTPVVDTLFFETEALRFSVVWRASLPIRRSIHEFYLIAAGAINLDWWASELSGEARRNRVQEDEIE
jgi:hypothetical protein